MTADERLEIESEKGEYESCFNGIGSISLSVMIGMLSFAIFGLQKSLTIFSLR